MTALTKTPLIDGWTVRPTSEVPPNITEVPATVPGSVHTDLMAAGLIPDVYLDSNERLQGWVGRASWEYSTQLTRPAGNAERVDLVFDGLDTVARVSVNHQVLGDTANMHRTYRFDVTALLGHDGAELSVAFSSAIAYADAQSMAIGARPHVNHHPFNAIRKMACSFGWDWGPDTATCGIWRPARLEAWSTARLASVRVQAGIEDGVGVVRVPVHVERTHAADLTLRITVDGESVDVPVDGDDAEAVVRVENPRLWWPVGYGEQPLSDVTVTLVDGDEVLDETTRRVGFRTVTWDMTPDAEGTPFTLVVNGQRVLVKGYNWIPDDCFPHRVTPERYRERFEQMLFSHANLIRVWGGGIFEDDAFYDLADELGLLTWQDFLLACAAYSEDEPLRGEFTAELRDNITRLGHHASLVLFNGNNENLWGAQEWGWESLLDGQSWGEGYYRELFPNLVAELAPHVPYTPGSPFSPGTDRRMNDLDHGSVHLWDSWNALPATAYLEKNPRFVAEFGWQGPPTWSTLRASVHDDPLTPESPGVYVHQKAASGNDKLTRGVLANAPLPKDMELWHWATQLTQANAVAMAVEHLLSLFPRCMGTVLWQINDCWPVISWAAVDGYGRRKPLLYRMRQLYQPRFLTVQARGEGLQLTVLNDSADAWSGEVVVQRLTYDGQVKAEQREQVGVDARGVVQVQLSDDVATAAEPDRELVRAVMDDVRAVRFFTTPRYSALEAADVDVKVDGSRVSVTANTLVRDLALLVDKIAPEAEVDDMLVTVLPGQTVTFEVTGASVSAEQARAVLVSANDLVQPVA